MRRRLTCPTPRARTSGQLRRPDLNGTYNRNLFSGEAARLIRRHGALFPDDPMYMYLAFMNIHDGCGNLSIGKQAPLKTVELYSDTQLDTYKVSGAMITELDYGVAEALEALRDVGMYDNTLVVLVSDNGGPLDHATNAPLRGGKHTFFEGGVRVMAFMSGGWLPQGLRGKRWTGMSHASDWYFTLVEGVAGGKVPANTGPRAPDGHNLWPALLDAAKGNTSDWSPRNEVVHQVENQYFSEGVASMRLGKYKIITGKKGPGDSRTRLRGRTRPTPPCHSAGLVDLLLMERTTSTRQVSRVRLTASASRCVCSISRPISASRMTFPGTQSTLKSLPTSQPGSTTLRQRGRLPRGCLPSTRHRGLI